MELLHGSLIWIVVWFALLAFWGYKGWLRHKDREMELRAMGRLPQIANRQSSVEMRRLGEELGRLRETSTQYDLTVEYELKELRERIVSLESKLREAQSRPSPAALNPLAAAYDPYRNPTRADSASAVAPASIR